MDEQEHKQNENIITVAVKSTKPRNRNPTWTDDEVHKLFLVWNQPDVYRGFLEKRKKHNVYVQVSEELQKLGVDRTCAECQTKIKNLKRDFKKATEDRVPQTFKFYSVLKSLLSPTDRFLKLTGQSGDHADDDESLSDPEASFILEEQGQDIIVSTSDSIENQEMESFPVMSGLNQPVQIEFELMSSVDFQNMKGSQLPIEIDGGSLRIPHEYVTEVDTILDAASLSEHPAHISEARQSGCSTSEGSDRNIGLGQVKVPDGTPLIVFTTAKTDPICPQDHGASLGGANKRKLNTLDISQKRRKLQSISDKMAETVERILVKTTNSLIDEMKASEERFMKWEEKRREDDQKREEQMLKQLVDTLKHKPVSRQGSSTSYSQAGFNSSGQDDMLRIDEMIKSSADPCAVTFDLLATKLTTMLTDKSRETEEELFEWETRMQKKETNHTDNLFKLLINAVNSQSTNQTDFTNT